MPSDKKLKRKIEKYEKRLERLHRKHRSRSRSRTRSRSRLRVDLSPLSNQSFDSPDVHDTVDDEANAAQQSLPTPDLEGEASSQEDSSNVVAAFQEALGVEYEDCTKFEGVIQTEISKRWNHVLINGLPKDEKDSILKKYKLPENCQLLEAPILNEEVKSVMTENSKIRDRSLEMVQHQLGMATAVIGQVMTYLIENKDIDKIQLVTKLTDASKLLNDIHFQKTRTRRQLISPLLDKNFICLVEKVKRDEHLYGMDLGTKIKTSQDLKKSSSQIKKAVTRPMPNKPAPRNKPVGNRYGPPRTQTNQQTRTMAPRGGPRNRVSQPPPQRSGYSHPRPERAAPRGHYSKR